VERLVPALVKPAVPYARLAAVLVENLESVRDLGRETERLLEFARRPFGDFQMGLAIKMAERDLDRKRELWEDRVSENKERLAECAREIEGARIRTELLREQLAIESARESAERECQCADREFVLRTCGHSFCRSCLDAVLATCEFACPFCSQPFTTDDIFHIQWTFCGEEEEDCNSLNRD
jgi:hypothetical protein